MRPDIMIIDDSDDQIQLMKNVCAMMDPSCKIITADGGQKALDMLRKLSAKLPKVILLDLRMPGKSGQETLSELKTDPKLKRIPVCIFSNADIESEVCHCYDLGASFYFKKPSGVDALMKFLEHFRGLWFTYASHCPR